MNRNVVQYWWVFALIFIVMLCAMFDLVFPFLIGFIMAYCFRPLFLVINKQIRNPSVASFLVTMLMMLFFITVLYIIIPNITNALYSAAIYLPNYVMQLFSEDKLPGILKHVPDVYVENIKAYLLSYSTNGINIALKFCMKLISLNMSILTLILIVPFVVFFVLRDWVKMSSSVEKWIPLSQKHHYRELVFDIDNALTSYLESQLLIATILSMYYIALLYIIDFKLAVTLGVFSGVLSFIPYAGCVVGFIMAIIIGITEYGFLLPIESVMVIFFIGYIVEIYILAPKIGKKLGLHTLWVFLALFVGIQICGPFGLMISIPTAITVNIVVKYLLRKFQQSALYKDA